MQKISRSLIVSVVVLLLIPVLAYAEHEGNGTTVNRFVDQPFGHLQCIPLVDFFPEIPAFFGQDICIEFDAEWSQTVTVKANGDVAWSTSLLGTAEVTSWDKTELGQGEGDFIATVQVKMDEIGRDLDGDAECQRFGSEWDPIQGSVMAEGCPETWGTEEEGIGTLDFLEHHLKITFEGETIQYYHVAIHGFFNDDDGFTKWCIWTEGGEGFGSNCPPGVSTEG